VKNASGFEESRILWTCAFGPWEVRNLDKRYDCGHIKEGRVNHESSRRVKQEFSGIETPKTRNPKSRSVENESSKNTKIAEPKEKLRKLNWNQNVFCSCWY